MLVLSRRKGEKIQIGENIFVTVTRIRDGNVSIGIEAPKEIPILRDDAKVRSPKIEKVPCLT